MDLAERRNMRSKHFKTKNKVFCPGLDVNCERWSCLEFMWTATAPETILDAEGQTVALGEVQSDFRITSSRKRPGNDCLMNELFRLLFR